ncbi:hypothetical protein, partial [Pleomorphovibrio marinus]|uniref:hypothetical protein n=1 Tax=Pleomorphovibrio marinus TaxID=2164132 RepID=UPI001E3D5911
PSPQPSPSREKAFACVSDGVLTFEDFRNLERLIEEHTKHRKQPHDGEDNSVTQPLMPAARPM